MANTGFGMQMVPLPLYTLGLGGSVFTLGLLGTVTASVYICGCFATGLLVRLLPARGLVIIGSAIAGTGFILLGLADSVPDIFKAASVSAAGLSLFWVSMENWLAEGGDGKSLQRRSAAFNVSWCSGLILGPWLGGKLFDGPVPELPFFAAAGCLVCCTLLVTTIVGATGKTKSKDAAANNSRTGRDLERSERLLPVIWLAQFTQWIGLGMIRVIWPKLAVDQGFNGSEIGLFFAALGLAQTLTFAIMGIVHVWRFKKTLIYVAEILAAAAVVVMAFALDAQVLFAAFAIFGTVTAFIYKSSIYYNLFSVEKRVFRSSMHEGLMASGALVGPIYGGALAHMFGLPLPFFLLPGLVIASVVAQDRLYKRRTTDG
jgi:DHA1 family tetracycline resistance protein-like MFS transporter